MVGRTISHYKILEQLGQGGMGVVYKAEDTKLRRLVALKFLSPAFLGGGEERERFLREAQAAASLDHPNICTVYEIDEAEGQTFLSMAYIDGQPLQKRIAAGPLKMPEIIDIAQQTAEGLQAAHRREIVHRDIKPANLMITEESANRRRVKIMDFGLAQLLGRSRITKLDSALGTAAYMSPEQSQGAKTDHRSDIWSLGVVIYEMVTGQLPFRGEYDQALIYSILNEPPAEPMTALRTGVPMDLERLVDKALAKNPDERYQNIADLIVDLGAVRRAVESGQSMIMRSAVGRAVTVPAAAPPMTAGPATAASMADSRSGPSRLSRREAILLAVIVLVILGAFAAFRLARPPETVPNAVVFQVEPPPNVWIRSSRFGGAPVISPDGRKLAFVGSSAGGKDILWVRSLDSLEIKPFERAENARGPFWSPDSRNIAFFSDGKLRRIDIEEGSVQTLTDASRFGGGAWGPPRGSGEEGTILFTTGPRDGIHRIPAGGGDPVPVTQPDQEHGEYGHLFPVFLPGGNYFLYLSGRRDREDFDVLAGSLDGAGQGTAAAKSPILRVTSAIAFAPAPPWTAGLGYLLSAQEGALLARAFDPASLQIRSDAFPVVQFDSAQSSRFGSDFSVSESGVIAYRDGDGQVRSELTWFDRGGQRLRTVGDPGNYSSLHLSRDQSKLAVERFDPQTGLPGIWVIEMARGLSSRLNSPSALSPVWSADGSELLFRRLGGIPGAPGGGGPPRPPPGEGASKQAPPDPPEGPPAAGRSQIFRLPWNSNAEPVAVDSPRGGRLTPGDWSADGRTVVYSIQSQNNSEIIAMDIDGGSPIPIVQTAYNEYHPQLSRDDKWIAYTSDESGRAEVYIQAFPRAGFKLRVSTNGGSQPRWRDDGKELYYLAEGAIFAAPIELGPTPAAGVPEKLFDVLTPDFSLSSPYVYDVSADGKHFIVEAMDPNSRATPITVMLNWQAKLRR